MQAVQDEESDAKGAEGTGNGQGPPAPNCPIGGPNKGEGVTNRT